MNKRWWIWPLWAVGVVLVVCLSVSAGYAADWSCNGIIPKHEARWEHEPRAKTVVRRMDPVQMAYDAPNCATYGTEGHLYACSTKMMRDLWFIMVDETQSPKAQDCLVRGEWVRINAHDDDGTLFDPRAD